MTHRRLNYFTLLGLLAGGCTGDIGESPLAQGPPPPPQVQPKTVPPSPDVLEASGHCTALREGEALLSVSPEGYAWLAVEGEASSSIRVLDALDPAGMGEVIEDVELTGVSQLQAWTAGDAAVLATAGLWRLEALARIHITPPDGYADPATLCGDPGSNGAILSAGTLFERRGDDQWWAWSPGAEGDAVPNRLLPYEGDCQSTESITWMTSPNGTLWSVEPTVYSQPVKFASLVDAAVTGALIAVLESDRLWIGPEWQPWLFPHGTPGAVSASGGMLWMLSGGQLLRSDGESWVEVLPTSMSDAVTRVAAYPGGVWLVGENEICHQATAPVLRVEGLRPYQRSKELDYALQVRASDAGAEITATLDGEPLALAFDEETGLHTGDARLDHSGWHTVTLVAVAADGTVTRDVPVKRLPEVERSWEEDIRPIYEASCAVANCHEHADAAPDISTYEAWLERADAIRMRVVDAGTMPPPASQGPEWGDDKVEIISQWLEGGQLP